MRAVLGVDAAWTVAQPSGVALAVETSDGWELRAVEASYTNFLAAADHEAAERAARLARPRGSASDPARLLAAARTIAGADVALVALDMPLAHSPIRGRRRADNAVSAEYGGRRCSTHSPSAERPGPVSDRLRLGFAEAGYPLRTLEMGTPGILEVYPHPALVELTGAPMRLSYKAAKTTLYWPDCGAVERRRRLLAEWERIVSSLDGKIRGVAARLPCPAADHRGSLLKAYEDRLDAVVCAWIGICALEGRARSFGDADAAIWVPLGEKTPADAAAKPIR